MRATIGIAIDSNCPVLLRLPGFGFSHFLCFLLAPMPSSLDVREATPQERREILLRYHHHHHHPKPLLRTLDWY